MCLCLWLSRALFYILCVNKNHISGKTLLPIKFPIKIVASSLFLFVNSPACCRRESFIIKIFPSFRRGSDGKNRGSKPKQKKVTCRRTHHILRLFHFPTFIQPLACVLTNRRKREMKTKKKIFGKRADEYLNNFLYTNNSLPSLAGNRKRRNAWKALLGQVGVDDTLTKRLAF